MKVRQNLYIDRVSDALEALASRPGGNKSRLVNDALAAWLARRAAPEIDDLLKVRLDRMSREDRHDPPRRRSAARKPVAVRALPAHRHRAAARGDKAARAIGRDRFEAFVGQVGRQIATGRRRLAPMPADRERSS